MTAEAHLCPCVVCRQQFSTQVILFGRFCPGCWDTHTSEQPYAALWGYLHANPTGQTLGNSRGGMKTAAKMKKLRRKRRESYDPQPRR